jgi:hypothetical protein
MGLNRIEGCAIRTMSGGQPFLALGFSGKACCASTRHTAAGFADVIPYALLREWEVLK